MEVELIGDKDLLAALRELRDQVPRSAVPSSLRKGAQWLAAQLQLGAPVGHGKDRHPGQLERSIFVKGSRKRASIAIRSDAYYWRFLERGWMRGRRHYRYPWAEPIVKAGYGTAGQIVINSIDAAITKVIRKNGGA